MAGIDKTYTNSYKEYKEFKEWADKQINYNFYYYLIDLIKINRYIYSYKISSYDIKNILNE